MFWSFVPIMNQFLCECDWLWSTLGHCASGKVSWVSLWQTCFINNDDVVPFVILFLPTWSLTFLLALEAVTWMTASLHRHIHILIVSVTLWSRDWGLVGKPLWSTDGDGSFLLCNYDLQQVESCGHYTELTEAAANNQLQSMTVELKSTHVMSNLQEMQLIMI